ncbi:MAG: GNAT family N-acetyltransferase [Anaerolineae bacterium]|nr:GNAT family N-acetyltransferase [Anaerolineae bacterium]MDW8097924.1 GNAT family N-acetyltransferase [Anaerolineae bacterium]
MEIRSLRPDELESWFDHCALAFEGQENRQYFVNHWQNDPWRSLETIFVALDGGCIVSTVRIFLRKIYLRGEMVLAGCLGEVCTHPAYRGRGLATRLIEHSVTWMHDHDIVISALSTGEIGSFYTRLGWQSVPVFWGAAHIQAGSDHRFDFRLLDLDSEEDLVIASRLHAAFGRRCNGVFVRDHPDYWRRWVREEAGTLWLATQGGEPLAYMAVREHWGRMAVMEYGCLPDSRGLAEALLRHAIAQLGLPSAAVWMPIAVAPELSFCSQRAENSIHYRAIRVDRLPGRGAIPLPELLSSQRPDLEMGLPSHHVMWETDEY